MEDPTPIEEVETISSEFVDEDPIPQEEPINLDQPMENMEEVDSYDDSSDYE